MSFLLQTITNFRERFYILLNRSITSKTEDVFGLLSSLFTQESVNDGLKQAFVNTRKTFMILVYKQLGYNTSSFKTDIIAKLRELETAWPCGAAQVTYPT